MLQTIELVDGVAMAAAHPDTFEVPSQGEIDSMRPGDYVKLGFIGEQTERMWVKITKPGEGLLSNSPVFVDLEHGDLVKYESRNVLTCLRSQ